MTRRPLLLWGFMATGKSTVGRRSAELAGVAHEDLDALIEREAGVPIAELFRSRGEPGFRELEARALDAVLADPTPRVISLGGGTLLPRAARLSALDRSVVVSLEASPEAIAARTEGDQSRPLLGARGREARIAELLESRRLAYAEAQAHLDTSTGDVEATARAALDVWKRDPIAVAAAGGSYAVDVGTGIAAERLAGLTQGATRALLVSDKNVGPLHADRLVSGFEHASVPVTRFDLEPGEPHKNQASLASLWDACSEAQLDRRSVIVALGGGVVSDIAGLCAATWLRGVRWIALPTTLLAMVDASVGGKTGIDLGDAKNAIGAFWQPAGVACDISMLATEPERGFASALSEVVKSALIGDPELFELLESASARVLARDPELLVEIVRRSVAVKARIVSRDERETELRAVLNLGHTVGHALEAQAGYALLTHGEAVSLGLVAALRLGVRLGTTPHELALRTERLLAAFGLPVELERQPLPEAAARLGLDKKRTGGTLRFVLARGIGDVTYIDLPMEDLREHVSTLGSLQ
jgi:shikimate kinase / 3-dehydroquinate synthase